MNEKLRLGLVGPIPPPNGGMALQTQQLARLLQSEGVTVEFLATNGPYRPALIQTIPIIRALCRLGPFLIAVWKLAGKVDVIHLMANSGWSWQLYCAPTLWLSWLRATPVVVNYRGGEAREYFKQSFHWVRPSLRRAAVIVVPSPYLQAIFDEFGEATQCIPNIIDPKIFHPRSAPKTSSFEIVITRNLEPIYGIDTALHAFAKAHAQDPEIGLRIAGSGPSENTLKTLAQQLGISHAVCFEGRLERQEIAALYAEADAMLNPSRIDNMPNSVLEALACGVPVISTDAGGVPYIVRHRETALLVPVDDVEAMAAAIVELKGDAELARLLRKNALAIVKQYTWQEIHPQWLALYASLSRQPREVAQ